jgi:hypothetical protein
VTIEELLAIGEIEQLQAAYSAHLDNFTGIMPVIGDAEPEHLRGRVPEGRRRAAVLPDRAAHGATGLGEELS